MDYSVNLNMANMNPMKDFMKITQGGFNGLDKINPEQGGETLKGYIAKNQIDLSKDPELVNDINSLVGPQSTAGVDGTSSANLTKSFSNVIGNYLNDVNNTQKASEKAIETFASGGNIDVHSVMIASEKANLSMQMTLQMRSKILSAYQEISRLQV